MIRLIPLLLLAGCTAVGEVPQPAPTAPLLLAHRALGQDYVREGLTGATCTATRWRDTGHGWLENTLPAMRAAFDHGADIVEFDVHPTTDGQFAVFHDWTLACRTETSGITRRQTLAQLKALDVGHGYTADGKTFPFRGKGVGLMPSLDEVLDAFPERRFLINVKSNDPAEGQLLADRLARLPQARQAQLMVYGGERPVAVLRERLPLVRTMTATSLKQCLLGYIALGWLGHVPASCERSLILVPLNASPWLAGFPQRFVTRMRDAGSEVFLINDYRGEGFSQGIDRLEDLQRIPPGYAGGIWTDRVDLLGAALKRAAH